MVCSWAPNTKHHPARATAERKSRKLVCAGSGGVGKTSLARRLCASLSAEAVLEQAAQNPFLERFYRNPRAGAFPPCAQEGQSFGI